MDELNEIEDFYNSSVEIVAKPKTIMIGQPIFSKDRKFEVIL